MKLAGRKVAPNIINVSPNHIQVGTYRTLKKAIHVKLVCSMVHEGDSRTCSMVLWKHWCNRMHINHSLS